MKKFLVTQKFGAPAEAVTRAFRSEATWRSFGDLPFVGNPTVASFTDSEPVEINMAYRVDVDLPSLAHNFIDPQKMTFIERTKLAADGSGTFEILPDHYAKMIKASGRIETVSIDGSSCERLVQGTVDLSLGWSGKLFEGPVEDVIVNGLRDALLEQAIQVSL